MRNYRRDPYGDYNPLSGYYQESSPIMFPVMHQSAALAPKTTIFGFRTAQSAVAVQMPVLKKDKVIQIPLDTAWAYRSAESVDIDERDIVFAKAGPQAKSLENLEPVNGFKAMWFAWKAYYPDTLLR